MESRENQKQLVLKPTPLSKRKATSKVRFCLKKKQKVRNMCIITSATNLERFKDASFKQAKKRKIVNYDSHGGDISASDTLMTENQIFDVILKTRQSTDQYYNYLLIGSKPSKNKINYREKRLKSKIYNKPIGE